jgi:hypothetical protein
MSFDQPEELTEQVSSKVSLDQHVQLIEEEDQDLLMIGGIGLFLPFTQEEAKVCVADDAAAAEEQSACQGRRIGADG